jgi:RNA polymerase sigma-70 factor, ECF subfamily
MHAELFEETALPLLNDLFRTALRMLGDRSAAEDCIQETYLQAQRSFHRFEQGTNCRAWMFTILFHVVHHYRRKWFRLRTVGDDEAKLFENTPSREPTAGAITDQEILGALDRIPKPYREVVLLADVEEFSYKEVSGILRIPIGTVMSRLSRGRTLLRSSLSHLRTPNGFLIEGLSC